MSTLFVIPANPQQADALATQLGEVATAAEWKRAAIVYARVKVGQHGGDRSKVKTDLADDKITTEQYALLGIHGLRSKTTIRAYWRAWDNAITEKLAKPVKLGDEVELPDAEWADCYHPLTVTPMVPPREEFLDLDTEQDRLHPLLPPLEDHQRQWITEDPDKLGLGHCPPIASGNREFIIVRDGGRGFTAVPTESDDEDDEDYDPGPQICPGHGLKYWVDKVHQQATHVLEILTGYDEFEETETALECIEQTRAVLTNIEQVLRGDNKKQ